MKFPSLQTLKNLKFTGLSGESLADYAYVLSCCRFPASVSDSELHHAVAVVCDRKILHLLSDSYDLDNLLRKYQPYLQ